MSEALSEQSILNKSSQDKFVLVLDLPPILKGINAPRQRSNDTIDLDKLQFSVEGTIVPSISIPSQVVPFSGQQLSVTSYARDKLEKNRVQFTVDNRFNNYWVLWKWLNLLNDAKSGIYNSDDLESISVKPTLHDYQTNITVYALDEYNVRIVQFKYIKAFITALGGIEYNGKNTEQIASYFEYDYSQFYMELL